MYVTSLLFIFATTFHHYVCPSAFHRVHNEAPKCLCFCVNRLAVWMRGRGTFTSKDPQNYNRAAIVYASDLLLARLVLFKYPGVKIELVTSLDHSVWFHGRVEADQWYLYVAEVEFAADGRSLSSCR